MVLAPKGKEKEEATQCSIVNSNFTAPPTSRQLNNKAPKVSRDSDVCCDVYLICGLVSLYDQLPEAEVMMRSKD